MINVSTRKTYYHNMIFGLITLQVDRSVPESPMEPAPAEVNCGGGGGGGPVSLGSMSAVSLTRGVDVVGKVGRLEEGSGATERRVR